MVKIYKPKPNAQHKGDTFRQLVDSWEKLGYVEVFESPDRYVWWNAPGDVLLHDVPLIYDVATELPEYNIGLFGNEQGTGENDYPWIFWGRNPTVLEEFYNIHDTSIKPQDRMWESIFIGKVENQIQFDNRFQTKIDWSQYIQMFAVVKGVQSQYPFSQFDYLWNMAKSKFALILPGYGPKCNRDIEACATGTIPIVTPGVCTKYYNEWEEGVNFIRMESEEDLPDIFSTDPETLNNIQSNNFKWYEANCTSKGSFETTLKIISENA